MRRAARRGQHLDIEDFLSVGKVGLKMTAFLPRAKPQCHLTTERRTLAVALAAVAQLLGTECFACGPPPIVMPLGIFPVMVCAGMPVGVLMVVANIAVPAVFLRLFIRDAAIWLHLGRSVLVYLVSKPAEMLGMAALMAFVRVTGVDTGEEIGAGLMLAFGGAAAYGVMCLLYRDVSWRKRLPLAFGFTLVGYAAAVILLVIFGEWWW
jgi:hypothetical protein